jgi:membrane protease YdiL (CAAX protease family)
VSSDFNPLAQSPPDLEPAAPPEPRENPVWSGWDVLRIAVLAVLAIAVVNLVTYLGLRAWRGMPLPNYTTNPKVLVPVQFVSYLIVVGFMYSLVNSYGRAFWGAVQWRWPASAAGYVAGGIAVALAVQASSALLPIPKSLPIEKFFRDSTDAWLMTIFGTTLAPLVEELFFRGFLYPVLARRIGVPGATVLTAGAFALIHQSQLAQAWAPLLLLFLVGLALTITRARTGSVAASFLVHVGYNATLFALLYVATDQFRHLERIS